MTTSTASVTTDTTNYTRIHLILMKGGTLLTKTLFLKRVKDLSPAGHELTVDEFLGKHKVQILLTSTGKNNEEKLYPATGTPTNLEEWDLPLYCFILKTVCCLPDINKLDMGVLKTMRNDLSHLHDPSLTDADFKNHLSTIEPIFSRSLQIINDPLFEAEMKTLLLRCETGALAVDEVVKVHHDSSRKHIELLSNQVKIMKNQVDMIQNQVAMLQNQTTHTVQMHSALSMLMDIKDRLPSEPDIPDVHVIIEVKNCTKEKEKELLDFLVKQFNETVSKPECTLNKDFPNLAMHTISEAICKTFQSFLEKGRHIIKVENKCISLTIKCNSISSFVCLVRDCMDGKLLDQLKILIDAVKSWEGCTDVNCEPTLSPDEITGAIVKLAQNINEKVPRRDQDAVSLLPKEFSTTTFDVSTSIEDPLPSCSTSQILRLTIKPETVDQRTEIEKCFSSDTVSNRLEQLQSELRKDPGFTNVEIKAKLLPSEIQRTAVDNSQESMAFVPEKHLNRKLSTHVDESTIYGQCERTQSTDDERSESDPPANDENLLLNRKENKGNAREQDLFIALHSHMKQKPKTSDQTKFTPDWSKEDLVIEGIEILETMFEPPDHYHIMSLRVSEVLNDIGVNEQTVIRRRRTWLLRETMGNIPSLIYKLPGSTFHFGSQSEGSTTQQLKSDIDRLICKHQFNVIQDLSDWRDESDKLQLLMVQDETTSPGYCLLQVTREDAPLPEENIEIEHFTRDVKGRVVVKHSGTFIDFGDGRMRHGPANARHGMPGVIDNDIVSAYSCSSWPKEAEPWLHQHNVSGWPTADIKRYAAEKGCFVVPVASRVSPNQDIEWRISTSIAERCLMFSLNMTQIRCYILMKMIINTFFKPRCEDAISSFMCKNVLFYCIADSRTSEWNDSNLLPCLNRCLQALLNCIITENCPHFIIPRNNLLAGKLSVSVKQQLVENMTSLTTNIEQSLLRISIDQLGNRLRVKSGEKMAGHLPSPEDVIGNVNAMLIVSVANGVMQRINSTLTTIHHKDVDSIHKCLEEDVTNLCQVHSDGSSMERLACRLFTPLLCASIGSILASVSINHTQAISPASHTWLSAGLISDFSSSRLKLASALYCAGQHELCERILEELSRLKELTPVISMCSCLIRGHKNMEEFILLSNEKHEEEVIKQNIAFCVRYLPCEINCVPKELKYEFLRSSDEDKPYLSLREKMMINWASVDSLPYMYFLQYMTYSRLQMPQEQRNAIRNLVKIIDSEPNLCHKETDLNLLGQCMEQENKMNVALRCYRMSLNERRRNNVANWHICRLLAGVVRQTVR